MSSYDLQHRVQGTGDWTQVTVSYTSHTHTDPAKDVFHEYQVRSRNEAGTSHWTPVVTATQHTGPQPPESIQHQPFPTGFLRVYWNASTSDSVNRYDIRQRVDGGEWTETKLTRRHKAAAMQYGEDDLLHEYQVRPLRRGVDGE